MVGLGSVGWKQGGSRCRVGWLCWGFGVGCPDSWVRGSSGSSGDPLETGVGLRRWGSSDRQGKRGANRDLDPYGEHRWEGHWDHASLEVSLGDLGESWVAGQRVSRVP